MATSCRNFIPSTLRWKRFDLTTSYEQILPWDLNRCVVLFAARGSTPVDVNFDGQGGGGDAILITANAVRPTIFNSELHPGFPQHVWFARGNGGAATLFVAYSMINPLGPGAIC